MAGTFQLHLDTTGPQGVALVLDAGNPTFTLDRVVSALASSTSGDAVMVKLWGDVDPAADARIQQLEGDSSWISLAAIDVTVAVGDGAKTIYCRLRDDVGNTSAVASDTITLDTTAPIVTILAGPSTTAGGEPPKLSKVAGFDDASITWAANEPIQAYKVKVVPAANATHDQGTVIAAAGGSTNVNEASGGAELVAANTPVTTHIRGADLEAAAAGGDGVKDVKVFAQDLAGRWSVL
jgi:hypothetical protein